ncbi:MAG: tRNA (N(6)-L-threonylcarbamoyladenosine(37)-C(2))-methylthiotransferase MtaB [Candidatus Krumholzibacteria bacterium]|nr:tRNA (N(6)-L-threonylcarbamoyladenosine(37)-C(2))-methylthiotransferase MtaB [Candidatus Krumholzibacteria bacterium]
MSYKVAFETLGCRLNQAESAVFARQFIDQGYQWVAHSDQADLCIINTCNLTSQATSKCRQLVRSIIRRNPDACIAAVGCYPQTDAEELREIKGLDYIIGTSDKMRLPEIIASPDKLLEPVVVRGKATRESFGIEGAGYYPLHTRANLKVQEGCGFVCSFCIIPKSRGPARSREFSDIVREAKILASEGHRELIITGVNIGTYEDRGRTLSDVVEALDQIDGLERIRLSSIEPTTIESRLIEHMARASKFCPYLHIPLQSGDDGILSQMRRKYTSSAYVDFVAEVTAVVPNVGLGTDVIVGFPGEDERAFRNTCRLVAGIPFNNIHVFSFSARRGTGAYHLANKVAPNVIAERSKIAHRLAKQKKRGFYESQRGRNLRVLFERRDSSGCYVGFSDNYVKVRIDTARELANLFGVVRVAGIEDPVESGQPLAIGELLAVEEETYALQAHALTVADCGT